MVSFIEKYNEHLNFVAQCDHKPGASLSICLSSRGGRGGWRRSRRRRGERLHLDQQPGRVSLGRWVSSFQSQGPVFRTFCQSGKSLDSVHDGLFLVQKDPLRSSFGHFWSFAEWNEPFPYIARHHQPCCTKFNGKLWKVSGEKLILIWSKFCCQVFSQNKKKSGDAQQDGTGPANVWLRWLISVL